MEQSSLSMDNSLDCKKYYWSPAVRWIQNENEVKIEIFSYRGDYVNIFPGFYFLTQKGIELEALKNAFPELETRKLNAFISDLIKKRILVDAITTPQEVFYPQSYLFKNNYSEKIRFDAEELRKFKEKQLNRQCPQEYTDIIKMKESELPDIIRQRKTYRSFDQAREIGFSSMSALLSVFRQVRIHDSVRYYYASAGGLYPVDIYVYIKEGRIENVQRGLYFYNPVENELCMIDSECTITKDAHYFTNQLIFQESAMSIFFIYNAEATMPKYGGMGYFYSAIDTGIMVSSLTVVAEHHNVGICSIGELDFKKIERYFKLNENQVLIHTVEVGLKPAVDDAKLSDI